jgi:hypothetical protein
VEGAIAGLVDAQGIPEGIQTDFFMLSASRNEAQIRSCFDKNSNKLQLNRVVVSDVVECPYLTALRNGDTDPLEFGLAISNAMKACFLPPLRKVVAKHVPNDVAEQTRILDLIFEECCNVALAKPEQFSTRGAMATIVATAK